MYEREFLRVNMKFVNALFCLIIFSACLFAQKTDEVLATANGQNYTVKNLSPEARKLFENLPAAVAEARAQALWRMITDALFEAEAKARNLSTEKLLAEATAKVPAPTDAQISAVYEANRAAFGAKPVEEVKPQIVAFLRREPEQKALQAFVETLKNKYKVAFGRDINAPDLKPLEALATVGGRSISAQECEEKNKVSLYEAKADVFDQVRFALEESVFSDLMAAEAKAQNIAESDLVAREITDRLREFSDEERFALQDALRKRLFAKYNARFLLEPPAPVAQNVAVDDDPARGRTDAPVTVVMFTDFQCPACAATHPVLKKVLTEYGDRVRFVVRDFPLTSVHADAFQAAVAAGAANAQGKFFEYVELLYNNQTALDAASLKELAAKLGLDRKRFDADLSDEKLAAEIRKDAADGKLYGINSTPTIFVNGVKVRRLTTEGFREAIEQALKK